jgi:hypothetical protein
MFGSEQVQWVLCLHQGTCIHRDVYLCRDMTLLESSVSKLPLAPTHLPSKSLASFSPSLLSFFSPGYFSGGLSYKYNKSTFSIIRLELDEDSDLQ